MEEKIMNQWMKELGPNSDVVVSSRVRLARNVSDLSFTHHASNEELKQVGSKVEQLLEEDDHFQLELIGIDSLSEFERKMLVEKHLISPEHTQTNKHKAVALSEDETISLMVNEEDHLRVQVLLPGLQIEEAWSVADRLDNHIEDQIDIAFAEEYGYLTACPTNVGTGLRVSIMVHLPALNMVNRVEKLMSAISQLGLAVRGLYGEGTETVGNLYQISNQVTLGHSEEEIRENLLEVTQQIIEQEKNARKLLLQEQEVSVKNKVYRAHGILTHAYSISIEEAMELISNVRLGIDLGIIKRIEPTILNQLMVMIRPATLQLTKGQKLSIEEREIYRAELIKELLD
ncbi:protein arginine kinase [Natroniella sulfidigena]|uniref:protein arginine kinase n=1 Tax=Natroniella sulfidigena TaxID=723921 RepID=UPI00200A54F9|nr:protein arginine kinase [Natroniella sulfidigena]MCK8816240.1 protein arginine kinase [Natroniella sulfidigena]